MLNTTRSTAPKLTTLMLCLFTAAWSSAAAPTYKLKHLLPARGCTSVDISPDGSMLVARHHWGDWDEGFMTYNLSTLLPVGPEHRGQWAPWRLVFSADGAWVWVTLYYDGAVGQWSLSNPSVFPGFSVGPWPVGLIADRHRRYLYVGVNDPGTGASGWVSRFDTVTKQVVASFALPGEPGLTFVLSPNDEYLYVVQRLPAGTEKLYKIRTANMTLVGSPVSVPGLGPSAVFSISPDGTRLYVPKGSTNTLLVVDTSSMQVVDTWPLGLPGPAETNVAFHLAPDGTHALVQKYGSPLIWVYDLAARQITSVVDPGDLGTDYMNKWTVCWDGAGQRAYVPICSSLGGVAILEPTLRGDMNCDGAVDFDDIDPFLTALSGRAAFETLYPDCNWLSGDIDNDGGVNSNDVDPFVALLGG